MLKKYDNNKLYVVLKKEKFLTSTWVNNTWEALQQQQVNKHPDGKGPEVYEA